MEGFGQVRMPRTEGASRALAVHEEPVSLAIDGVLLLLAGVVRHVVEKRQARLWEQGAKRLARQVREDLSVGERAIHACPHRAQVTLADGRADRRAGELALGERNPRGPGGDRHFAQELGTDLVTQTAR